MSGAIVTLARSAAITSSPTRVAQAGAPSLRGAIVVNS
jgi:hypothetical protein